MKERFWGQAYSFGLAAAALSAFAGGGWRWVFVGCAVPAVLAIAYVPRWIEADRGQTPLPLLAQVAQYARKQTYRLAGYASFGGVSMHFVVVGLSTVYFVAASSPCPSTACGPRSAEPEHQAVSHLTGGKALIVRCPGRRDRHRRSCSVTYSALTTARKPEEGNRHGHRR